MSDKQRSTKLLDQEQALSAYLNDMLNETDIVDESPTTEQAEQPLATNTKPATTETASTTEVVEPSPSTSIDEPMQVLLMQLHGLKLAISVQDLSGILKWPEHPMSKIPGKPSWYLGVITNPQQYTQVVDIGHILLPEQTPEPLSARYIVLIDDNRWGLACEKVSKVVTLEPDEIKWRRQAGQRKWLAGTLLDEMYNIIDVNELSALLNTN